MSLPDLNPCPCCDTRLAPTLADSARESGRLSFGVWVTCPSCEMAGPRTWLAFKELTDTEIFSAQVEAARAWNRISAACRTMDDVTTAILGGGSDSLYNRSTL